MHTAIAALLFVLGLYLIIKGGDLFVDAAAWIALKSGIPAFVIGATVVSIATTLPEMLVSVFAALEAREFMLMGDALSAAGRVDITIGNAVGSATANLGLIMAISLFWMPSAIDGHAFRVKALLLLAASVALCAFGLSGAFGLMPSLILSALFFAFIAENIMSAKHASVPARAALDERNAPRRIDYVEWLVRKLARGRETAMNMLKFALGAAGIAVGARMLVDNGTALAHALGVPESIIGVTMIAVGTSLPELITTLSAIKKGVSALSIGNIVGANVIDLTLILPVSALVSGTALSVSRQSRLLDLPFCALLSVVAVLPPLLSGLHTGEYRFSRAQGGMLLTLYAAYIALVIFGI